MEAIITAYDKHRLLGRGGELPWQGELPADMQHLRELTVGSSLIMGRKTFESIGRVLPGRINIVVSRQTIEIEGAVVAHSLDEAFAITETDNVFVFGGAEIYRQSLERVDRIYATEIAADFGIGDTYFPELPDDWQEIWREDHSKDQKNKYDYSFVLYRKTNSD
ncbi:MAG TPA: dihydrofolate reductase [Candidatus Saccharimonadales bacterium]|nr:dihydrofolate reductase [Candidatus Saccharimonadales bacterium]